MKHPPVNLIATMKPPKGKATKASVLDALYAVELITEDDFCEEISIEIALRPGCFNHRERVLAEKIGQIYRIVHGSNPSHCCHHVHKDWRKEVKEVISGTSKK